MSVGRVTLGVLAMVGVLGALGAAAMAAAAWPGSAPAVPSPRGALPAAVLQALEARCRSDMLRQACRAMTAAPGQAPNRAASAAADLVFIAGAGAFPASVLAELQAAGDAMCDVAVRHCRTAPQGPGCRTARALYGQASEN